MSQPPVVLGLDFGGTKIAMTVCEPNGDRLASSTVASGGELGAAASFDRGIQAARALLAEAAPGRGAAEKGTGGPDAALETGPGAELTIGGNGGRREPLAAKLAQHHGDLGATEVDPEHNRGLGHDDLPVYGRFRQDS